VISEILSAEQRADLCECNSNAGMTLHDVACNHDQVYEIEAAVVAALAARGEVDIDLLANDLHLEECEHDATAGDLPERIKSDCYRCLADAIRLAVAQTVTARSFAWSVTVAKYEAEIASLDAALAKLEENR